VLSKPQKRLVLGTAILVIVVLFIVPAINVNRFRLQVARSLSQALGREVTVQAISIQTFPQPGLLLSGVVVDDDPTISAEPMLRADEVLATLRISSLWRGRLEIGKLQLNYPSLNLVRSTDGRWNIESLLERARETPTAPTAKTRPERRARFPYIELNSGRVNLKVGNEKKVFALNDADFAIWLASENEWRMRLEARPIRTDANLSDTGTLKVQGSWRRAPQLHETPVSLTFSWEGGQLGEITHLIYGRDRGWRGGVHVSGTVSGKPENFAMRMDARVDDFRRYDILSPESVVLRAHCDSDYNFTAKQVRNLACQMPAGSGMVLVNGNYDFVPQRRLDLSITAENVPMQFLSTVARHAKRDMPSDMNVTGMLSAVVAVKDAGDKRTWAGNGEISEMQVQSSVLSSPLVLAPSRWLLVGPGTEAPPTFQTVTKKTRKKATVEDLATPSTLAWKLEPVEVRLHDNSTPMLSGWFAQDGYYADLRGEADLGRLFEVAKLAGLPTPASDVTGTAKGAVQLSGEWAGFQAATVTGDAQLRNVTAKFSGVAGPLRISAAHFMATKDAYGVSKATGSFAGVHSELQFSALWPQNCSGDGAPLKCALDFNVSADELNVDEVNSLLNPRAQKQPWYAALANTVMGSKRTKFPEVRARGQVSAAKVIVKNVRATQFSGFLAIAPSTFSLTNITADMFGGKYSGEVQADLGGATPAYMSQGELQNAVMTNVASLMKDPWASGSASISYRGQLSGWDADELLSSATATAKFEWHNGGLPHIELASAGKALQFKDFSGTLDLSGGVLTISPSKLQSASGIYLVSGTASLGRRLQLKVAREGAPAYSITGTIERPTIALLREPERQPKIHESSNR
jgi:AsmA family/AsmA-like C-terminal region